ncbi:MAG: DUF3857 domain-containing protein [Planctomycetes bacterium]|nr:DUF3857 domain-containing protein [Planctomycetota bacterium]
MRISGKLFIATALITLSVISCRSVERAAAPKPITPDTDPAISSGISAEKSAEEALVNGDWPKAYQEYQRLLLTDTKSPLAEYYFYRLLQVSDYEPQIIYPEERRTQINQPEPHPPASRRPSGRAGITQIKPTELIGQLIESPATNENLRALVLWITAQTGIKKGEIDKAGQTAAQLGFINDYLYIGPFENEEETGFNTVYEVEQDLVVTLSEAKGLRDSSSRQDGTQNDTDGKQLQRLNLDKTYPGKAGQNKWFSPPISPAWGVVDLSNLFRLKDDVLAYALTYINSPIEQMVAFRLGSDGAVKLWLNDQLLLSSDTYRRISLDQNIVGVKLNAGWNKVLLKTCQKAGPWRVMLRVTDAECKQIPNLKHQIPNNDLITKTSTMTETAVALTNRGLIAYLEDIIKENPDDIVSLKRAAFIYDVKSVLDENDRKDRDYIKKALELDSNNVLTHLAFCWAEPDRNKRMESYRKCLELAPKSPLVYYELSRAYTTDPAFFKGLDALRDWWESFSEQIERWQSGEGDSEYEGADYEKEIRKAQKHTLSPKRMPFPVEKKEVEYLGKALELKPDWVKAKLALARVYQRKGGGSRGGGAGSYRSYDDGIWLKETRRIFTEVLAVLPDVAELKELLWQGKEHTIDEEIEFNEGLLKTDFTYKPARTRLVGYYRQKGNYPRAAELCNQMLRINPWDISAYETLARIQQSQDNFAASADAIKQALGISPENTKLLGQLANYYLYGGKEDKAIAALETSLKIRPQQKETEKHLKYLKSKQKKEKEFWEGYEENLTAYIEKAKTAEPVEDDKESARWILNNQIIRVKPNGTSSTFVQQVVRIFDDRGRNYYQSVYAFPQGHDYYPSTRSEVKQAKIIRKDGTEIEGQWYENSSYASFQRLEVDDIIVFECQIDEVGEGRYRDYFGLMCPLQSRDDPIETAKLTLISPKDKPVYYQAIRCKNAKPTEIEKAEPREGGVPTMPCPTAMRHRVGHGVADVGNNQIIRIWTEQNIGQIKEEPFSPSGYELWPYVHFSTFKTWNEVAEWIWGIAKDQFETSPELKEAARKAVANITINKDKIKALYQMMVSDVRYEHLALESHYFKPFKAADTFSRKYGDCKDTAVLMAALLQEVGIPANIVLVRAMPQYMGVVNTELPSMKIFNHMIAHTTLENDKDFFMDGTARYCGVEEFPYMDQGAVVFVVKPGQDSKCLVTSYQSPEQNLTHSKLIITLASERDALIEENTRLTGQKAPNYRQGFQEGTKQKLIYEQAYNQYFKASTVEELLFSDLKDYNKPVEVKARVRVKEFLRQEGNKLLFKPLPVEPNIFGMALSDLTRAGTRHYDMVLYYPEQEISEIAYNLPDGYKVKNIPGNILLENDFAEFSMTFNQSAPGKIEVKCKFTLKAVRIPRDGYEKFRNFCTNVHKAWEQEIVLEKK